jgi:hypothetical protein
MGGVNRITLHNSAAQRRNLLEIITLKAFQSMVKFSSPKHYMRHYCKRMSAAGQPVFSDPEGITLTCARGEYIPLYLRKKDVAGARAVEGF